MMIVIAIILALTGLIGVAVFSRRDEAKKALHESLECIDAYDGHLMFIGTGRHVDSR